MHGLGNDFVLIDCRDEVMAAQLPDISALSRKLCNRRFGIGADQILLLYGSDKADFRMRIFNADGSEVEMCGNGIRCFAKYIWDRGLSAENILSIETLAGKIKPEKSGNMVKVDMGEPVFEGRLVPVNLDGQVKGFPLKIMDREFQITCVSMGNPHAVIFVDDVGNVDLLKYGPLIETDQLFPKRTNVEFIQVLGRERIRMRVWERGAGETMACGTGAAASAVASALNGLTNRSVTVSLPGGDLVIDWAENNRVYMTGPAIEVFEGIVEI